MVPVSKQRLALHRREECPSCHASGGIRVEQTIKGDTVLLQWLCSTCQASWPVVRSDEQSFSERRSGPSDRRRKTRSERRSR